MKAETERVVKVESGDVALEGMLGVPDGAEGVVLFAHGSGSGRFSPRNQYVARVLRQGGLATLLIDLLREEESNDRRNVFDIGLLADRLLMATDWLQASADTHKLSIGYFGASTGAAAALQAAAERGPVVKAVVSRGGRPDMARDYIARVTAPTLFIVGEEDQPVIPLNQEAYLLMQAPKQFATIAGATHLFEEPGALEQVARLAREWFSRYLIADEEEEQ